MYGLYVFWTMKLIHIKIYEIPFVKGKHLFPIVVTNRHDHDDHITIY